MTSIEERFGSGSPPQTLIEWAEGTPVILDGKAFSFHRHEYLRGPYEDTHPHQVFMKAAQLGLTSLAMLRVMYGARWRGFTGILYLFPSRSDAIDFSKSRITPLIEDNPDSIGSWVRDTDSAGLKELWRAYLYVRGMRSRTGLKSIPIDYLIMDELDEAPQSALSLAWERMAHSEFKEILKLSNPSLPDFGVDREFQTTDMRYYLLKCESCNHWTCLEDTFPDCLIEKQGEVIRGCVKCGAKLDPAKGEWVAKQPGIQDKRGYHFSQLFSDYVSPREILEQYRTTTNMSEFFNLKIGVAHVEASDRLTREEVLKLCGSEGNASQDSGPSTMGIDQGKTLHVVISKRHRKKAGQIIHLGVYKDWEDLDPLMKRFNVIKAVVDGLPEQRNARAFAERHPEKVFLSYYSEHQKGNYAWNESQLTVSCNRTESLDASHNELLNGQVILPRHCDLVEEFADHCHNIAKKLEEDEETGSKRYIYVKLGPDHFRHAYNYEAMARHYCMESFFADSDFS